MSSNQKASKLLMGGLSPNQTWYCQFLRFRNPTKLNLFFVPSSLFIVFFLFASCQPAQKDSTSELKNGVISKADLIQLKKDHSDLIILDVRTVEEAAGGIIPGAFNVDFHTQNFDQAIATLNKDVPIVVYCQSGGRSGKTVEKLHDMGFDKVYDFQSYDRWLEEE